MIHYTSQPVLTEVESPPIDKVKAIIKFSRPTSDHILSFLGLSGFCRRFIKGYAGRAAPLITLLENDTPFNWTPDQEKSFSDLKTALTTAPVLAFPDHKLPFTLYTDASYTGIGAVLMQQHDSKLRSYCLC
ncbi:uncharacterized protein LOC143026821 [Oratosquilla oratoria]|uniref:uncharacterized protein LOC143026821 n=1 Tax=Oratosquilla oratoria TaxID=337810 RepID=UPI003F7589D4